MTSNTSPEKPDWFALIEKDAPSAQVRKIDKKLPAVTGFLAITIVALGTFFTNSSMSIDSSAASNSAGATLSAGTSASALSSSQVVGKVKRVKVVGAQSINKIADPTLNGGGNDDDDDDEYEEEDEYEDDDDHEDDDDRD
jgi:hypothetical protein